MSKVRFLLGAGVGLLAALTISMPAHALECPLEADFNKAIQDKNVATAKAIEAKIKIDSVCGPLTQKIVRERVSLEVALASALPAGQDAERERLLVDADEPLVSWAASVQLGRLRYSQKKYAEAFQAFDRALEIIKNPGKTVTDPGDAVKKAILDRATESRRLAANEDSGNPTFVASARDFRDLKIGGSYSAELRGLEVKSVPLPINFKTGTDEPTEIGQKYADELFQAIQEQAPSEILIVGHTDPRGSPEYNMELSWRRANAVAKYLKSRGITANIKTLGRGFYEQLPETVAKDLSKEEIWALARRVEWRRP